MNRKIILFLVILVSICAISNVSAVDNLTDTDTGIMEAANDADEITISDDKLSNNEYRNLQERINQAKENETITLDGSTYDCDYLININKTITIDGNGSTLIFNGEGKNYTSTFFYINYTASNVVLKNLKFTGGNFLFGGAITWHGDYGSIINCTFEDNLARGTNAIGGAVLVLGNYCNITDSIFRNNEAHRYGGAVLINGTGAIISNCEFTNNEASGIGEGTDDIFGGGALLLISDYCLVENCNFTNNRALESVGGAIAVLKCRNATLRNSKFNDNYITGISGGGGAIYSACYGLSIDYCSFVGNNASNGGAISMSDKDIVKNSYFKDNHANKDEQGYQYGNDIAYFGNYSTYNGNIISNIFILDFGETEQYAIALGSADDSSLKSKLLSKIIEDNTFNKTKKDSTIQFTAGIIFEYGATSSPIQIIVNGGKIEEKNIKVLNHPEAKIFFSDNKLSVSGLSVGNYILSVTSTPDEWYNEVSRNLTITVNKATAVITAKSEIFAYKKSSLWSIKLVDSRNQKPIANMQLTLKVFTGKKYKLVTVKTDSKGEAKYQAKGLSTGNHKVIVSATHSQYNFNTLTSSIKVVKQTAVKFKVTKKTRKDGASLSITVNNKKTKKPINGVKIKLLIYTGKQYKVITLKTMKKGKFKGVCGYATNKLSVGMHKVKIMPVEVKYGGSASSSMKITKKAKKVPAWETKDTAK